MICGSNNESSHSGDRHHTDSDRNLSTLNGHTIVERRKEGNERSSSTNNKKKRYLYV